MPIHLPDDDPAPHSHPHLSPPSSASANISDRERLSRLQAELKVANMGRIAAERKAMELEDVLRGKERLMEDSDRMAENAWSAAEEMRQKLAQQDIIIERLRADAAHFPLSTPALLRSHQLLSDTFDTLRETLTCPICFNALSKSEAVSLGCGHTFCSACLLAWTSSRTEVQVSAQAWKAVKRWDCPECRTGSAAPTEKRVRLWMLEEAIRLVGRAERERETVEVEEKARRDQLEKVDATLVDVPTNKADVPWVDVGPTPAEPMDDPVPETSHEPAPAPASEAPEAMEVEEEPPAFLFERRRAPYGGVPGSSA